MVSILHMITYATTKFESSAGLTKFAAAYGCSSYGSGSYNQSQQCTTPSRNETQAQNNNGGLANTGDNFYFIVAAIVLVVVLAVAALIALRRKK